MPLLWVDAICINQTSISERSHQVNLMRDIYQRSQETSVWLGSSLKSDRIDPDINPGAADTDAFRLIRHFWADRHCHDLSCFEKRMFKRLIYDESADFTAIWNSFEAFTTHSWWTRLWTVQEVVLPRKVIFYCGASKITMREVVAARQIIILHSTSCCRAAFDLLPKAKVRQIGYFFFRLDVIRSCLQPRLLNSLEIPRPVDFDTILRRFNNRVCKDPRDKIYGLLGLVRDVTETRILSDYSLAPFDVYIEAMRRILEISEGQLRTLTGLGLSSEAHNLGLLPSWTRNFALHHADWLNEKELHRLSSQVLYRACGSRRSNDYRLSRIDGRFLRLQGICVGRLQRILSNPECDPAVAPEVVRTLHHWAGQCRGQEDSGGSVSTEPFWRTVTANASVSKSKAMTKSEDGHKKGRGQIAQQYRDRDYLSFLSTNDSWELLPEKDLYYLCKHGKHHLNEPNDRTSTDFSQFIFPISVAISGRCMFKSTTGDLGLCYPEAREGDEIWVLYGSNVPFLLRRLSDASAKVPVHRFVSECFYDGVMYGEALGNPFYSRSDVILR
ncbi:heterokaryon incompatibility protein-domain-containing protein [Lophiotrema nucula]|uniref:Heterokaryon incompatibility protein-domain-containing protein n=1 Tax=Lophiotrema nucula TaxID=690887 RepID=A0A6A5ZWD6_9PLEO|nr:heterokaryon incompatibility protein-domain-containing protein [Lophiotrema nucula]